MSATRIRNYRGPLVPQLQEQALKISHLVIAADVAVVAFVEKGLMAGHRASAGHPAVPPATPAQLIIVGLVFGLPILVILLVAALRGRTPAKPAPRPFGSRL